MCHGYGKITTELVRIRASDILPILGKAIAPMRDTRIGRLDNVSVSEALRLGRISRRLHLPVPHTSHLQTNISPVVASPTFVVDPCRKPKLTKLWNCKSWRRFGRGPASIRAIQGDF